MMHVRRLVALLMAVTLTLALAACGGNESEEPAETSGEEEPAAEQEPVTLGELPTDPGYAWDVARDESMEPLAVSMSVEGPWVFPSAEGWTVSTTEIADPADVPSLDQFDDYDFVVFAEEFGAGVYYPRRIADGWMLQLGRIDMATGEAAAEAYDEPLKLWPVDFEVGESYLVLDGENFRVDATILAQNAVTVPAGEIDDAYLVRFDYTPKTEGAIEGTQYYILAPDVGFVAMFGVASGDESSGFTALEGTHVLATLPEKR